MPATRIANSGSAAGQLVELLAMGRLVTYPAATHIPD